MIDIHTIGAGGGSIAYVDSGGTFKVGPQSAGSQPGPAAYGRGGTSPTVTDANLVLGRLDANNFLGGNMKLDAAAAHKVIGELARNLHLSPHEAAEGAITVVNSNMANAIRSRTVQKGIDPRDYALVAFGGAGPLHGAEVAAMVGIPEIIVPPYPGITSSMGLLTTDIKYESLHTVFVLSTDIDLDRLNTEFAHMRAELTEQFRADGFDSSQIAFRRSADARYVGQGYELRVDLADDVIDATAIARAFDQFHAVHKAEYGHAFPQSPIEIVNIRLTGVAPTPAIKRATVPTPGGSLRDALLKTAGSFFRRSGRLQELETAFYRRDLLPVGDVIEGPAIVLQTDTTTVVPPDSTIVADGSGNLIIRLRGGK
jgi:N-methylhydantoinase A